jgi:O-antigen/teichoic acid export membrane protein
MVLFLGVMLAVLTFLLNWIFIPLYGIIGSAFATLLSITAYSFAKLFFVVKRMHLYPFSKQTIESLGVTFIIFLLLYFWQFPFHPIIGIVLKSILLAVVYVYANYKMVISPEINQAIDTAFAKLGLKK